MTRQFSPGQKDWLTLPVLMAGPVGGRQLPRGQDVVSVGVLGEDLIHPERQDICGRGKALDRRPSLLYTEKC